MENICINPSSLWNYALAFFLSFSFFRDNSALRMVGIPGQNGKICVASAWKFLPLFLLLFFILSILILVMGLGAGLLLGFKISLSLCVAR